MKKLTIYIFISVLGIGALQAQIKNQETITASIKGNCGMCKKTIEKAGNEKNISAVNWDADSQTASISFDKTKTSKEAILKKIAQVGYDNESFRAPDDVYAKLHECCLYDRDHETAVAKEDHAGHIAKNDHAAHSSHQMNNSKETSLNSVYGHYLGLKDALVASNANTAASHAKELSKAIQQVDMGKLEKSEHDAWMKVYKSLEKDASAIAAEKSIDKQRINFINLSNNLYSLAKVAKADKPLYWQFCPMANNNKGAFWLSSEQEIKNPYFGSKMLTCGSVKEKI
ncbi:MULTISPECIES: DUF3347 domain-containing protein [Sphingobacterium]|uniref:DUF3347 domain-containing protein n=1 Tax=Sphingobacterium tenebrionis TaxID=3111775 RepID=A0ABU8I6A3_9SPHI|nr:DUF3347 domain-containing protein [Sphingobacterium sp. CZ-2]